MNDKDELISSLRSENADLRLELTNIKSRLRAAHCILDSIHQFIDNKTRTLRGSSGDENPKTSSM